MKKIVVTTFQPNGEIETVQTMGLRNNIDEPDFAARKKRVAQILQVHSLRWKVFVVQWKSNGFDEGYLVRR